MTEIDENTLVEEGAIPPNNFHDYIERIREVSHFELEVPDDIVTRVKAECKHLLVDDETILSAAAAIQSGHLILQGPPGTGKSSLARALCRAFNASVLPVTAHEDWTVFEVVGRLELHSNEEHREEIRPVNGFFTEAAIRCAGSIVRHFDDSAEPQAEWLLIDELNRAYLDKAFGELFTVIGTDEPLPITLPHQRIGNRELVVPRRLRIVGTINSVDRQFVNSLSQAIRRRFTFVTVDIPPPKRDDEEWSLEIANGSSLAVREFALVATKAAGRVARRFTSSNPDEYNERLGVILGRLENEWFGGACALFDFVAALRYVSYNDEHAHVPIGTAQLIDTMELFFNRALAEGINGTDADQTMDWAASVKIVPLLEGGSVPPDLIRDLAERQGAPFNGASKREMRRIVAAGLYYVE